MLEALADYPERHILFPKVVEYDATFRDITEGFGDLGILYDMTDPSLFILAPVEDKTSPEKSDQTHCRQ